MKDSPNALKQIASRLHVPEDTVIPMAKRDDNPHSDISTQVQLQEAIADDWLTSRMQSTDSEDLVDVIKTKTHLIPVPRLIQEGGIVMDLEPGDKESVLRQLITPLKEKECVDDPDAFLAKLLAREAVVSTAIQGGIALPHVRIQETSGVKLNCIVLGICKNGTAFDAVDKCPTNVFFLICACTTESHLRLLAKISLLLREPGIVSQFCLCSRQEEAMQIIQDAHFDLSIRL
jgi:mannitol/fructose-specific phosphotransferase system IIA component (Ntr-type)